MKSRVCRVVVDQETFAARILAARPAGYMAHEPQGATERGERKPVPENVRKAACASCLWASIECRFGSMYEAIDAPRPCGSWAYYD